VLECAVIGVRDLVRGEQVLAIVAPKSGAALDPEELSAFAAQRLARYKLPRRFEFRAELPKAATGKISKGLLREQFAGR
jgi:long-chain acyl-CoA synthetase